MPPAKMARTAMMASGATQVRLSGKPSSPPRECGRQGQAKTGYLEATACQAPAAVAAQSVTPVKVAVAVAAEPQVAEVPVARVESLAVPR